VIHFDAHADTGKIEFGSLIGHGQPMRLLIDSGAARGDRFLQVGLRGYWPPPDVLAWMAEQGMRSFEMTEIGVRGLDDVLTEAMSIAMDDCDGVFLSVDIDVADPGHARHGDSGTRWSVIAGTVGRGPPDLLRGADCRDGRGGGLPAIRPFRHHGDAG
jgi:arginase family enzyme